MYRARQIMTDDKRLFYNTVRHLLENLLAAETDWLANLSNAAALLGHQLQDINWVGFYLYKQKGIGFGPISRQASLHAHSCGERGVWHSCQPIAHRYCTGCRCISGSYSL